MATQEEIDSKHERIDALRQEIADYKVQQAIANAEATLDYQLGALAEEELSLEGQLRALKEADEQAANVKTQAEQDAEAFAAAKEAEAAAAADAEAAAEADRQAAAAAQENKE